MSEKVDLKVDFCSHEAAKWAVEHWHYSRSMPVSKRVNIGVWESDKFVGALVFAWGANPNLCKPFGLKMVEVAELVRVALFSHSSPVSRIITLATKMLKKQSPGVRLIVSFADPYHNHLGIIYQASNWVYTGETSPKFDYLLNGQVLQRRSYTGVNFGRSKMAIPPKARRIQMPPKYRYLYPLDRAMRKQIESLSKPYPKRDNVRLAEGSTPATSQGRRFNPDQAALAVEEFENG